MPEKKKSDRSGDSKNAEFLREFLASERRIRTYIRALVFDRTSADDVFQEASITMLEKYDQLEPQADFVAWACRIAWFKILEWRQTQSRDQLRFGETVMNLLASEAMAVAGEADRREGALEKCAQQVSSENLQMLLSRHRDGETVEVIASRLHRTTSAVYKALSRTRRFLRECIQRELRAEDNSP